MDLFTEVKVDEETARTGAMIALRPRQDHVDRLAVVDGEPPEELHTTILFLGKGADYSYDTRARIIYAMREVAQQFRYVTGNGFGVNIWNPQGPEPCIVLGVGGSELVDIRNAIVEKLQGFDLMQVPEQHEPWQPHVTLTYTDDFTKAAEYVDLAGDVVYDAIRVVFSGIVDDIPLQSVESDNDGYAGGNRYAAVPLTVVKSFRPDIRVNQIFTEDKRGGIKTPQKCKYCKNQATNYVLHSEGYAYVPYCPAHKGRATTAAERCTPDGTRDPSNVIRHGELPQRKMLTVRIPVSEGLVLDEKVIRRVRTAAGVRRFGQPIGSVIVGDGTKLSNLKTVDSEYDGYEKYTRGGKAIYVHKSGGKYEAVDENDNVIASHANQESLLKELDGGAKTVSRASARKTTVRGLPPSTTGTSRVPLGYREFVTAEESEYDGYHKYKGKNGKTFYAADDWSALYDEEDNVLAKGKGSNPPDKRRSLFDAMVKASGGKPGNEQKPARPAARKTPAKGALGAAPISASSLRDSDDDAYAALTRYSNTSFEQVNPALRTGKNLRKYQAEVAVMDSAIKRSPLKRDVVVYRGITNAEQVFGKSGVGKVIADKAFLSTSTDRARAARFTELSGYAKETPALITIRAPKGTHAIHMDETNESELLFERGLKLRVVSDSGSGPDRKIVMEVVR
jgi:2'-5' RNA ligase